MSVSYTDNDYIESDGSVDWERLVDENREAIEREANSDSPAAWVFQRVLESTEEGGDS